MNSKTAYTPRHYQHTAQRWIEEHPRCALFAEMGLGKTVVTLTAVQRLIDALEVSRVLIAAPKKVAEATWTDEAAKWQHLSLRVVHVTGTAAQREQTLAEDADVYVIGRDSLAWLHDLYVDGKRFRSPFDMVVLDELTTFKNRQAIRWKAARDFSRCARRVVGLTGTPTPQGLQDLWAQMYVIDLGERLGQSLTRWRDQYFDCWRRNNIVLKMTPKPHAEEEIRRSIGDICLTLLAKDNNPLPPMQVTDHVLTMPPDMAKGYAEFERDSIMQLTDEQGVCEVTASSAAALMNKLAQYTGGAVYDDSGEWHAVNTLKLDELTRIIGHADSPVLVFYQYRHEAERIAAATRGKRVRRYEGADDLRDWNNGSIDVLLAHPASTAFGLNMQHGGHIIVWYGTGWNLELYQQANARLHRQGQQQRVTVHRIVCGGTVDIKALAAIDRKASGQRSMMTAMAAAVRRVLAAKGA